MDKLIVHGGKKLKGTVKISGAKNAALPCLAAVILGCGKSKLHNIPQVADIKTMGKLLSYIGIEAENSGNEFSFHHKGDFKPEAPYDIVKTMRASSLVLGPILAKFGRAKVSLPGGCAIGTRPLNLHLAALEQMGAKITLEDGYINAEAKKLNGANITFDNVTVTGTENIMMAAALAKGTTVLFNAAREPEVSDLADMLIKMGAKIEGAGTDRITIEGVDELSPADHTIISDRIEAGTFACASAITGGDITVENCPPSLLEACLNKLSMAGCEISHQQESFRVKSHGKLQPVDITTAPFPGFATDLQAQFMACMTIADGTSVITETIFENRFMHAQELIRLGADIKIDGRSATIKGVKNLIGAPVMASDLRASASLVLAGLAAEGKTEVQRIYHLNRGYENLTDKFTSLGADIKIAAS